ncbi:MAG TPA: S46 family peptidase [Thermoanaerobaculia bacterium]|nr:S46 family peptidase [Thermoanaerobaculia bacterium]
MKTRLFLMLSLLALPLFAGEGMWMPQQIPQLTPELQKMGMTIDPNRFADLTGDPMGAVISLGNCTASFVSADGLVVTNHHCGFGAIQFNTTPQRDLITNGFLAKTREEELPAGPGSRIFVTTNIEDVTSRITGNLDPKLKDLDRFNAIDRHEKELVDECEKPGGLRCRVASFFEGAQFFRITQMEIRDVRLVYAPPLGIGDFGGETDNWMWPRHTGDWSYLRAYVGEDGKPANYSKENVPYHPAHILKVATSGVTGGDAVIVAGYPGRTFRYRTAAEVKNAKEFTYPTTVRYATELNAILREAGKNNKSVEIKNASRVKGNDNTLKNYQGSLAGFENWGILDQRQKREADLAAWMNADSARAKKYAGVLDTIARLDVRSVETRERDLQLLQWLNRSSPMLTQATSLYHLSLERPKNDLDRESGYQQRDWARLAETVARAQKNLEPTSDRAGLRYIIREAAKLPASERIDTIDKALAATGANSTDEQIEKLLDQIYGATKIAILEERKKMMGESTAELLQRNDSMINFAAALSPLTLATEQRNHEIDGAMSRVRPLYLEALRESGGGRLYPDANGTLRVTFGKVEGYAPRDAVWYNPQTTVSGIAQKNTYSGEFDAPKAEIEAIKANKTAGYVDPKLHEVPVNFLSTVDTTGGNSGSPTLNSKGELCGLLFDGNYEALGSDFLVRPEVTRSIHVDAVYMLWVMDAVDGAGNLLHEMGITPRFAK